MKETGITMTGDHPAKILAGTKTMTRRVIKEPDDWQELVEKKCLNCQIWDSICHTNKALKPDGSDKCIGIRPKKALQCGFRIGTYYGGGRPDEYVLADEYGDPVDASTIKCPYGQVGDRLWVRETYWQGNSPTYGKHCIVYDCDKKIGWQLGSGFDNPDLASDFRKRPSRFMFKWATRIWLEITEVRVERLQEITGVDCQAEGIEVGISNRFTIASDTKFFFEELWDSLNAKRGYGWEVNPWVWVISFRRLE